MERIRLSRMDDVERMVRGLRITIRMKARGLQSLVLLSGLLSTGLLTLLLLPTTIHLEEDLSVLGMLGILTFVVLPGLAMLAQLVWTFFGRETLLLRGHLLCISRSIGPLCFRQSYSCLQPPGPMLPSDDPPGPRPDPPFWELLCLETTRGCMGFCNGEQMVQLARNLDKAESVYLITAIRILMQP